MALPERWSQYEAHRASSVANPVVYLYLTHAYRNGSPASLLVARIAKAEYVVLPFGAFLRTVQYGLVRLLVDDQVKSACLGGGAWLEVPRVLGSQ